MLGSIPTLSWIDADVSLVLVRPTELDRAIDDGKDRMIPPQAHVLSRPYLGAALPDDDGSGLHYLTVKPLYAKHLGFTISSQSAAAT